MRQWKTLQSTYLVQHPIVNLRQDTCKLPNGRVIDDYYVVEEHDVVLVFALTESNKLVLVEQYKHGVGELCLEIPGGYLDSATEDPLEAMRRELAEETGYTADKMELVATFINQPTRCTNRTYLYAATNVQRTTEPHLDPNEDITIHLLDMPTVFEYIQTGQINVALSVAGIYMGWNFVSGLE